MKNGTSSWKQATDNIFREQVGGELGIEREIAATKPQDLTLKRQLPMANLRKILAVKPFRISHQIHKGFASVFIKPFSSRLLQIFTMFNCRFKV